MFTLSHRFMEGEPGAAPAAPAPAAPAAPAAVPAAPAAVPAAVPASVSAVPAVPAPAAGDNFFAAMPDDWRTQLAGDDSKRLSQLERVSDMPTLVNNYFSAQDKIRKGELSSGIPENASADQMKQWREANGVPETPADYTLSLEDGLVLGDEDNRIMANVLAVAHDNNISSDVMSKLTTSMLKGREIEAQNMSLADDNQRNVGTQQLKQLWGNDFTKNCNAAKNWLGTMPESVHDEVMSARMPSGMMLTNSPDFIAWSASQAFEMNPSATVVPNSANPMQSINDEIIALEARMGTDEWYKDKPAQTRYQELLIAKERMEK